MEEKIILRTYNKVWKFERKVYALDSIRLPVPIVISEAIYFVIGLLITIGLLKLLPFLNGIPFILRYTVVPYLIMKFLTKKKFDGKLPHMFLVGYVEFLILPKKIARFQAAENYRKGGFTAPVYRGKEIINKTDNILKKKTSRNSGRRKSEYAL